MLIKDHLLKDHIFLKSPNFNDRPNLVHPTLIVIHCISLPEGSYDNQNVEDFFLNKLDFNLNQSFNSIKDMKVSSHIYIKRCGKIIQFVPFNKRAWHAGISCFNGIENCNDYSIGIELQGTDQEPYEDKQYISLISITSLLLKHYDSLNKNNIVGHSDIAPNRKSDPGKQFDWNRYIKNV